MRVVLLLLTVPLFVGCAGGSRLNIADHERISVYVVGQPLGVSDAFDRAELWVARTYGDAARVTRSAQRETGTIELRPVIEYKVGGPAGAPMLAPYDLRIEIQDQRARLRFELHKGRNNGSGLGLWAPRSKIPEIRAQFERLRNSFAAALTSDSY